jgi:cytochrome c oxidase subunit 4
MLIEMEQEKDTGGENLKDLLRRSSVLDPSEAKRRRRSAGHADEADERPPGRLAAIRAVLTTEEIILIGLSFLLAGGFFLLVVSNMSWAGNLLTTDSLFFTTVALMMAGLFAIVPAMWLRSKGLLKNPFRLEDEDEKVAVDTTPIHFEGTTKLFLAILGALLVLTLVEVLLAYVQVSLVLMLVILIGLSVIKAVLIVAYFMHLRFERLTLVLTLIPMLVVCICLLLVFFPDSFRSSSLRYRYESQPVAESPHE